MTWGATLDRTADDEPSAPMPATPVNAGKAGKYTAAALENECLDVATTPKGERNERLNKAAFSLGQLIGAGALDEGTVIRELATAAQTAGLGKTEIEKTIASGIAAGKKEPREIPEPRRANGERGVHGTSNSGPPADDYVHTDEDAPPEIDNVAHRPRPATPGEVIAGWRADGPLVHEPTGIKGLDERTGGGPVYGTRWYVAGSPDAGKTALMVQLGDEYLSRGIAVGLLCVDEEPTDIVTRLAQRRGWSRQHCEVRDPGVLADMATAFAEMPLRLYDADWTIERAAHDLAGYAAQHCDRRAMFGVDSVQTVTCDAEIATSAAGGREMSEVQAVTARSRAIRAVATKHRLIAIATSELGRAAYRSKNKSEQSSTLSSAKWSGAIEYSARVLLGLKSVAGESDLIEMEIAKNKHGRSDECVYLRIDRWGQTIVETSYEPPPEPSEGDRDGERKARVMDDAVTVANVLAEQPGMGVRDLRAAVRAKSGAGHERVDAAVQALGKAIVRGEGKRGARPMTLDPDAIPVGIKTRMEARNA